MSVPYTYREILEQRRLRCEIAKTKFLEHGLLSGIKTQQTFKETRCLIVKANLLECPDLEYSNSDEFWKSANTKANKYGYSVNYYYPCDDTVLVVGQD